MSKVEIMHKSIDAILNLFESIRGTPMIICGDGMLDKYSQRTEEQFRKLFRQHELIESDRRNPEANAPIYIPANSSFSLNFENTVNKPGGAFNVAVVAARLGAKVDCIGFIGANEEGEELRKLLTNEGIHFHSLHTEQGIIKHRIFVNGEYMCRIDQDPKIKHDANLLDTPAIQDAIYGRNEIVESSYNKGFDATPITKSRRIILDAKPLQFKNYQGLDVLMKINVKEASDVLGIDCSEYEQGYHINQLQGMFEFPELVITLGKEGAECIDRHGNWHYVPAKKFKSTEKYNVIGRGDIHLVANAIGDIHKAPLHIATELGQYLTSFNAAHGETAQINAKEFETALKNHAQYWD